MKLEGEERQLANRRKSEFRKNIQDYSFSEKQIRICRNNSVKPHTVKAVVEAFIMNSITGDVSNISQVEVAKSVRINPKTVNLAVKAARQMGVMFCKHQYEVIDDQRKRVVSNTLINLGGAKSNNKFFEQQKLSSFKGLVVLVRNALNNQKFKKPELIRRKKKQLIEDMEIVAVSSNENGVLKYLSSPLGGAGFYGRLSSIACQAVSDTLRRSYA